MINEELRQKRCISYDEALSALGSEYKSMREIGDSLRVSLTNEQAVNLCAKMLMLTKKGKAERIKRDRLWVYRKT